MIQNPILPGFHPDPSLCKVGDEFYLATSTFEWFPGVMIYQSKDLKHWRLAATPLDRKDLLNLRGEEASCGVWAPCLTHDGERFHLVYSDSKSKAPHAWDVTNYLTTAESIEGPWSDRITLNHCGFDPSMFHDDDGKKWLVTLSQDPRPGKNRFGGIELQEYAPSAKKLVGEPRIIFTGTDLGCTEGPHLYRENGWVYLMLAEGGTGYGHAVTLARSRHLEGPYDVDPEYPMLTSRDAPELELQKAGHASLVEAAPGEWVIAHLCSRPVGEQRRCILGRETALQRVEWTEDGWLRLQGGGRHPRTEIPEFSLPDSPLPVPPETAGFNGPALPPEFQTLREPFDASWGSLAERPGWLRLYGRRSLYSNFDQSLVGRRVQHFHCEAETLVEYAPRHIQQLAGLVAFYDDNSFYALRITFDPDVGQRVLRLTCSDHQKETHPLADVALPEGPIRLRVRLKDTALQFSWAMESGEWQELDHILDATLLSDEYSPRFRFTGAYFCLHAQDMTLQKIPADFHHLIYRVL